MGFIFREKAKTLSVGTCEMESGYEVILSCRTLDTVTLLDLVLPELKKLKVSFRLVKDQESQYRLNSGAFGENEVGKVLVIFISSLETGSALIEWLVNRTAFLKGPVIPFAKRIGEIVYLQAFSRSDNVASLSKIDIKKLPFAVSTSYLRKDTKRKFIGRYYLPVAILKASPKGDIYRAINLRRFSFTWCLIKEGKPVALDDHFNRDMRHRLQWQRDILLQMADVVNTPALIDFIESGDTTYLITAFAEGEQLGSKVHALLNGTTWARLANADQIALLTWYSQALDIVKAIHQKGFVHRDITDSNFIISDDGKLSIIDFELAFHIVRHKPDPPFLLGTFGYAAPEQLQYAVPDFSEDIYSLGALLCHILTGIPPYEMISDDLHTVQAKLSRLTENRNLTKLAVKCLSMQRSGRPLLIELKGEIIKEINSLKQIA